MIEPRHPRAGYRLRRRRADRASVPHPRLRRARHRDRHGGGHPRGRARPAGDARRRRHRPRALSRTARSTTWCCRARCRRWSGRARCCARCCASARARSSVFRISATGWCAGSCCATGRMPMTDDLEPAMARDAEHPPLHHPRLLRAVRRGGLRGGTMARGGRRRPPRARGGGSPAWPICSASRRCFCSARRRAVYIDDGVIGQKDGDCHGE